MGAAQIFAKLKTLASGPQELIGVDIGSHSVKVVSLTSTDKTCVLKSWGHAVIPVKQDTSPEERKFLAAQAVKDILSKKNISGKIAATSIAGNSVIVRYVVVPKIAKQDMAALLPTEAEPFIPFDIKEVNLGHHILRDVTEDGQRKMEMVLVAAKKEIINDKLDVLNAAGLHPLVIDVDSFAIESIMEKISGAGASTLMVLNIGHKMTNLVIIEKGLTKVARDILIAGNTLTKAITKKLGTEPDKSETLKKKCGLRVTALPENGGTPEEIEEAQVSDALSEVVKDLIGEVKRSVDFYLSQGADRAINKVLVSGGSAGLYNLTGVLSSELKMPVEILDPFAGMQTTAGPIPKELLPSLAVAAGLASRKVWDWE